MSAISIQLESSNTGTGYAATIGTAVICVTLG
jgi:hypothetical protein